MQGTLIPKITFQVPREGKYQTVYLLRRLITSFVSKWFFLCTKFCYNLDMDLLISFRMVYFSTVVYHHCQHMNQHLIGRMRGHWFLVKGWLKAFHLSITGLFISYVSCNLLIWFCYFIILKIVHFLMISNSVFCFFLVQWIEDNCQSIIIDISGWISWWDPLYQLHIFIYIVGSWPIPLCDQIIWSFHYIARFLNELALNKPLFKIVRNVWIIDYYG